MRRAMGGLPHSAAATVKAHVRHIYAKLGIHSRAEPDALVDVPPPPTVRKSRRPRLPQQRGAQATRLRPFGLPGFPIPSFCATNSGK